MLKINVIGRSFRTRKVSREDRLENPQAGLELRWAVEVLVYEQENWYPLVHAARFKDRAKAERCAQKVREAIDQSSKDYTDHVLSGGDFGSAPASQLREDGVRKFMGLDLRHWDYFSGITVPFVQLQPAPTAVEYAVD